MKGSRCKCSNGFRRLWGTVPPLKAIDLVFGDDPEQVSQKTDVNSSHVLDFVGTLLSV